MKNDKTTRLRIHQLISQSMSLILKHFDFEDELDVIWTFCFFLGTCIVAPTLFTFTLIIQHLYCIPKSPVAADLHSKWEPTYAFMSSIFATLCVLLAFSTYPVCTEWKCAYNTLGRIYHILILDTYILSKFPLHLLLIGRLFNPYYHRIYQYPQYVQYLLWMLLIILMITMVVVNTGSVMQLSGSEFSLFVYHGCSALYVPCWENAVYILSISTPV